VGAVTSLERLRYGTRLGLRAIPEEVMATFATPFQALPHPRTQPIVDTNGQPVAIDLFDVDTWRARHWGVYSPEVATRSRGGLYRMPSCAGRTPSPPAGRLGASATLAPPLWPSRGA